MLSPVTNMSNSSVRMHSVCTETSRLVPSAYFVKILRVDNGLRSLSTIAISITKIGNARLHVHADKIVSLIKFARKPLQA